MTNQPFAVPGQRVMLAISALKAAGIEAQVTRGMDGNYLIAVADDDREYVADTLAPMLDHPLLVEKRRRNWLQGWLGFTVVGLGSLALLGLTLAGVAPGLLTGLAVFGVAPLMIAGVGAPIILGVVWVYMVNLRVPWSLVLGLVALWLVALGGSILISRGGQ